MNERYYGSGRKSLTLYIMARTRKTDLLLKNLHGQLGKQLVVKQYDFGAVVTKYPNMRGVKRSIRQKDNMGRFKEAVAYAQSMLRNSEKRAAYAEKLEDGRSVYHAAIREFLSK